MKPAFEAIHALKNNSFLVRKFEEHRFSAPYHFHPEYELTLIISGYGKRYVGTHMHDYKPGDLVLLGASLPHCWKTEAAPKQPSASIVVQFQEQFLGPHFWEKPELAPVRQLLQQSRHGLQFSGDPEGVKSALLALAQEPDAFKKLLLLLQILNMLTALPFTLLASGNVYADLSLSERERINAVMAYIVENFQTRICLDEAAATANLTPHAFCKYFKRITRKTFIEAVNDYRIDFAVRQLVYTDKQVAQIGFDSGFEDSSNFYKTFRQRMQCSPLRYRRQFLSS